MAWSALVRTWNKKRKTYDSLILRIDEAEQPGCLMRLYEGESAVAEVLEETPQLAMAKALEMARAYLKDASLTEQDVSWIQVR